MATYKIIGKRFLRKYTAESATPVYAAATDAAKVAASLCDVPWQAVAARQAVMPTHGDDDAPKSRDLFDAALFCGEHSGDTHRAYANAAVYRYVLPDAAVGASLSSLAAKVTSDPYNSAGCRLHLFTNSTGEIPTACNDVRGNGSDGQPLADGTTSAAFAPREAKAVSGKTYWYPVTATAALAPADGLTLQKYLFLAVVLEDYSVTRANWLEGSSFIENAVSIATATDVSGWTDGATYDLSESAESEIKVVEGGVLADLPSGSASPVRSLTLQRTGDEFAVAETVKPENLFARPRVSGVRVLDLSQSPAAFASPWVSGPAGNVAVTPGLMSSYLYYSGSTSSGSTTTVKTSNTATFALLTGDFADGSFSDLPGLLILKIKEGACTVMRYGLFTANLSPEYAETFAAMKSGIAEDGGIGGAHVKEIETTENGVSTTTMYVWIYTKKRLWVKSGTCYAALAFKLQNQGEMVLNGSSVNKCAWTSYGGTPFSCPAMLAGSYTSSGNYTLSQTIGTPFVHDADKKKIYNPLGSKMAVSYVGTVTAIRPVFATTDADCPAFAVSGDLTSVGGVSCSNVALVKFPSFGAPTVTVPSCDALITPDTYRDFAVSCPLQGCPDTTNFYVTGGFKRLGGVDAEIAAKVSGTTVTPLALPSGTRPPEFFLLSHSAGATIGQNAFWVDDTGAVETDDEAATDVYETPKAAVTDAQSAFGLRRLYAGIYSGLAARTLTTKERVGAAFTVRGDEISVRTGTGDGDVTSAKCWNVSEAALAVPFSCPRDFAARKVRLKWGATAATDGSRVRVWLKRGAFLSGMPTDIPKALHFAAETGAKVGEWEFVGTVTPSDATAGEATFEIDPITDDLATLLFVAFVGQDDFNPSADMTLPRGIGTLNVNEVAETQSGLDGGFKPDITLIG